ncbi:MAG: AEC family transporter [Azospirillaceae bacterium]
MNAILLALAPIFLLILLGGGLRRIAFVPDDFWAAAEKAVYYLFFPCLLFSSLAGSTIDVGALLPMALAMVIGVVAAAAALLAIRPVWGADGPAFSSIFQGGTRPNTYVGLAAAFGLLGDEGVTLCAIGIAFVVPTVNIMAVMALVQFANQDGANRPGPLTAARAVVTNPLIIAIVLGLAFRYAGLGLPPILGEMTTILGRASLPLGLLAVGAGLDLRAASRAVRHVALSSTSKLFLVPAITVACGFLLGVEGAALTVAVLYNGLPTSASSYVLARQMGGDATLMAGIITMTTLAGILSLPIMLSLAELLG